MLMGVGSWEEVVAEGCVPQSPSLSPCFSFFVVSGFVPICLCLILTSELPPGAQRPQSAGSPPGQFSRSLI